MKIVSMTSLGKRRTFSPEMKSDEHNYITGNSKVVHKNSHAVSYCLMAFRCLWLKKYFPQEWAAAVMSNCNADKLVRYINSNRAAGVKFVPFDINNLTKNFVAVPDFPRLTHLDPPNGHVSPGLISLKGVGDKSANAFSDDERNESLAEAQDDAADAAEQAELNGMDQPDPGSFGDTSVEPVGSMMEFVERKGKDKKLLERLIKLGAFKQLPMHLNTKATWILYQINHCSGVKELKAEVRSKLLELDGWDEAKIESERMRQVSEYRHLYPKRSKVPSKIENWEPKIEPTIENLSMVYEDFTLEEVLKFEEEFLGYALHSPLDLFVTVGNRSIAEAKVDGLLECVIVEATMTMTKAKSPMCKLLVSDGIQTATLILWSDTIASTDREALKPGRGVSAKVDYDDERMTFTLSRGSRIHSLIKKEQK